MVPKDLKNDEGSNSESQAEETKQKRQEILKGKQPVENEKA